MFGILHFENGACMDWEGERGDLDFRISGKRNGRAGYITVARINYLQRTHASVREIKFEQDAKRALGDWFANPETREVYLIKEIIKEKTSPYRTWGKMKGYENLSSDFDTVCSTTRSKASRACQLSRVVIELMPYTLVYVLDIKNR